MPYARSKFQKYGEKNDKTEHCAFFSPLLFFTKNARIPCHRKKCTENKVNLGIFSNKNLRTHFDRVKSHKNKIFVSIKWHKNEM